ncbi:hypothetical protein [Amycolatopsis sp. VC5-11]|uniref:hypothetical protein n=1 Tax=Amycolatopsis sp. VC5-11 TaxID=3120156 RepID=UPI00300969AC
MQGEVAAEAGLLETAERGRGAEDIAANAVALEDAYGLHLAGRNTSLSAARTRELLLGYLAAEIGRDLGQA